MGNSFICIDCLVLLTHWKLRKKNKGKKSDISLLWMTAVSPVEFF